MSTINYIRGDATAPSGDGPMIIAHICNDVGGWGRGFVLALSQRWQEPEVAYRQWYRSRSSNDFDLGATQLVAVEPDLWVANIIGQHDIRAIDGEPPVRYWAMEAGLAALADEADAMGASVHMPRIGCGLAGGEWPTVEAIIERTLSAAGVAVVVYDL
jgi:O-acetyl-ADP-ribose deacetylase (regulator of RNase III)